MNTPPYTHRLLPHLPPSVSLGSLVLQQISNRRRPLPARQKPRISKLVGVPTWVCRSPGTQHGFGLTPSEAYRAWKHWRC